MERGSSQEVRRGVGVNNKHTHTCHMTYNIRIQDGKFVRVAARAPAQPKTPLNTIFSRPPPPFAPRVSRPCMGHHRAFLPRAGREPLLRRRC